MTSSSNRKFLKFITVKTDFVGFHKYDDAPEEVAFLKNLHRHRFYVEASIEVKHNDRELEFFMVLDQLQYKIIPFMEMSDNISSCEDKAEYIANGLLDTYGEDRSYHIYVSEDDENGAGVMWPTKQ